MSATYSCLVWVTATHYARGVCKYSCLKPYRATNTALKGDKCVFHDPSPFTQTDRQCFWCLTVIWFLCPKQFAGLYWNDLIFLLAFNIECRRRYLATYSIINLSVSREAPERNSHTCTHKHTQRKPTDFSITNSLLGRISRQTAVPFSHFSVFISYSFCWNPLERKTERRQR